MQHFALVIDAVRPRPAPLTVVHLGGGALTMPRWVAATRPGSRQLVVESAADVIEAVAPLGPVPGCDVVVGDAIVEAARVAAGADLVVWDLYDGPRADTSALTLDAVVEMRRMLSATDGLLVLNVSDAAPFDVVRPVLAAVDACFPDVMLVAEPSTLRGRRSGNCIVVGSTARLPLDRLSRLAAAAPVRARVVAGPALSDFVADAVPGTARTPLPQPDEARGRAFL
jgi:spermidine synthase